ncbi:MAG: hypothetical protein HZC38_02545 [Chloroflexi bacterium]|nr:hypothetical protein [Chloroflexota bacterium]
MESSTNHTANLIGVDPAVLTALIETAVQSALQRAQTSSAQETKMVIQTPPISQTLADFSSYNLCERGIRQSTSNCYVTDVKTFEKYILSTFQRPAITSDLTPTTLREFIGRRRKQAIAEATLERQAQGLIAYSEFLCAKELILSPLTLRKAKMRFRKQYQKLPRIEENIYRLLMQQPHFETSAPLAVRNWAMFNILDQQDLAITVALQLKMQAIDLANKKIAIGNLSFALTPHSVEVLEHYLPKSPEPNAPLFPSRSGKHIHPSNYRKLIFTPAIKRIASTLKVRSCHPHDLPNEIRERLLAKPTL